MARGSLLCSASPCSRKAVGDVGDEECWDPDDLACWDRGEHSCRAGRCSEADPAETSICCAQVGPRLGTSFLPRLVFIGDAMGGVLLKIPATE